MRNSNKFWARLIITSVAFTGMLAPQTTFTSSVQCEGSSCTVLLDMLGQTSDQTIVMVHAAISMHSTVDLVGYKMMSNGCKVIVRASPSGEVAGHGIRFGDSPPAHFYGCAADGSDGEYGGAVFETTGLPACADMQVLPGTYSNPDLQNVDLQKSLKQCSERGLQIGAGLTNLSRPDVYANCSHQLSAVDVNGQQVECRYWYDGNYYCDAPSLKGPVTFKLKTTVQRKEREKRERANRDWWTQAELQEKWNDDILRKYGFDSTFKAVMDSETIVDIDLSQCGFSVHENDVITKNEDTEDSDVITEIEGVEGGDIDPNMDSDDAQTGVDPDDCSVKIVEKILNKEEDGGPDAPNTVSGPVVRTVTCGISHEEVPEIVGEGELEDDLPAESSGIECQESAAGRPSMTAIELENVAVRYNVSDRTLRKAVAFKAAELLSRQHQNDIDMTYAWSVRMPDGSVQHVAPENNDDLMAFNFSTPGTYTVYATAVASSTGNDSVECHVNASNIAQATFTVPGAGVNVQEPVNSLFGDALQALPAELLRSGPFTENQPQITLHPFRR